MKKIKYETGNSGIPEGARCNFCGSTSDERHNICSNQARTAFICDMCVEGLFEAIAQVRLLGSMQPRPGEVQH